ncbi:lipopolysaccharide-induced tumor necrosis factor-alpha factor homolog [Megachile rotundata]|uniref:lipopolysaccharide-induced tumor necrosis factor-alpha factor homolog n=1 Tax=Megachile rotundata TaxID=143995 RepID=UPI00061516F8|nr:PREDICTED: lipopolysaccharide-induced tumor necrosis factor-alpha factor homolog [Megachile rotundata]XP_012153002.1 PREDICTED: lipopolysaccharide-induced tumor necrosis factor-alpha factor homolog [Megachile rotundata]
MSKEMPQPPPPGFAPSPPPSFSPPPPPPPYHPGQPNVVIVGTQFGPESQRLVCPYCHAQITTSIETEANTKTHLFALLLCVLGLWCCAPCPYCIDSCMVKKHYCPSCKAYLGQSHN